MCTHMCTHMCRDAFSRLGLGHWERYVHSAYVVGGLGGWRITHKYTHTHTETYIL